MPRVMLTVSDAPGVASAKMRSSVASVIVVAVTAVIRSGTSCDVESVAEPVISISCPGA
jgi:hypothetical protein